MAKSEEYRGVAFSVPNNDNGVWHFKIHAGRTRSRERRPHAAPLEGYNTRESAVEAAKAVIDSWLVGRAGAIPRATSPLVQG